MFGLFLAFYDASGERLLKKLEINSFWLPSAAPKNAIEFQVNAQTGVLIEIYQQSETAMLTNFDECTVLGERQSRIDLPISTATQRFTVLLREGDHILTPAGRWEVLWEDEHSSIHNSMRPPALPGPLLPSDALDPLETEDTDTVATPESTPSQASAVAASDDDATEPVDAASPQASPTTASNEDTVELIEAKASQGSVVTASNDSAIDGVKAAPPEASPVTTSNETRAATDSPSAPTNSEKAVDVTSLSTTAKKPAAVDVDSSFTTSSNDTTADVNSSSTQAADHGDDNDTVSTAPSSAAPATSKEPKSTQTPAAVRKRPSESLSVNNSNKRVRFTPPFQEAAYENDESAQPEVKTAIQVIVPSTPSQKSVRKSKKKRPETSSVSPAANTRAQTSMSRDWAPVVYMATTTTIDQGHKKIMRSFHELGGSFTKNIVDADVLCVGNDKPLKKSGSLLLAVTSGKPIVTEDWIIEATRKGRFPATARYLPQDPDREREWGFNLAAAVARGREGLTHLFAGSTVYLTKRLQESVTNAVATELSKLATALGADGVKKSAPSRKVVGVCDDLSTLVVLGHESDPELRKLVDLGLPVYSKDLLTMAALRGQVELKAYRLASAFKEEEE